MPFVTVALTLTFSEVAWVNSAFAYPCPAAAKPSGIPTVPRASKPRS